MKSVTKHRHYEPENWTGHGKDADTSWRQVRLPCLLRAEVQKWSACEPSAAWCCCKWSTTIGLKRLMTDRQTDRHAHAIICHPLLGKKRGFTIWLNLHLLPMSTYQHSVWEASSSTAAGFEPSLRDNFRLHLHVNIQPGEGSMPTNIDSLV